MIGILTSNIYSQILYMLSMMCFGCYKNINYSVDILHHLPFVGCLLLFTIGISLEMTIRHDYSPVTKKIFGNKQLFGKKVSRLIRFTTLVLFLAMNFLKMSFTTFLCLYFVLFILHSLVLLNNRIKKNKIYETILEAEQ